MSLNWREINAVLAEAELAGAVVADVAQPDYTQLLVVCERGGRAYRLRIDHAHGACVAHITARGVGRGARPPRFMECLRARLVGGVIMSAIQLADQRIVRVAIRAEQIYWLWIRLWSGAANTILTDASGTIIDLYYRRPKRGEMPGENFMRSLDALYAGREGGDIGEPYPAVVREYTQDTFSAFVDAHYRQSGGDTAREAMARAVGDCIDRRIAGLEKSIKQSNVDYGAAMAEARRNGELLTRMGEHIERGSAQATLRPPGASHDIHITLDPRRTPRQNAEHYFRRYRKLRETAQQAGDHQKAVASEVERLRDMRAQIDAMSFHELKALRGKMEAHHRERIAGRPSVGMRFLSGRLQIMVGRSAEENDRLLREFAKPHDIWMHVRNRTGSSVFIRPQGRKSVPLETLYDAAILAHYYSKAHRELYVDAHYTHVKYVRKARGKAGGMIIMHDRSLQLKFDRGRLARLHKTRSHDML